MYFDSQKYIDENERVVYQFGLGIRYISVSILSWAIFLGGTAWWLKKTVFEEWWIRAILIGLMAICFYYLFIFLDTIYQITDKKIVIFSRFFPKKTKSLGHHKVDNMEISQGFFERIFFNTGTLLFRTESSENVVMPKVENPHKIRKKIHEAWKKNCEKITA